jgi:hypothetical protein
VTDDQDPAGSQAAGLNQAAIDWAWAQQIANNPGARVVLMCLARRVNEMWECTASQEEVAMDALVSGRSARRYLDQLEECGFIARQRRVDGKGLRLPDAVRLSPSSDPVAKLAGGPVANLASGSDQQLHPVANLAGGDVIQWPNWPVGEHSRSSDPVAKLAGGQEDLWPDWPMEPLEGENPSSDPSANLASGSIPDKRSSSSKKKKKENLSSSEIREDVEQMCARLLAWLVKKDYRQRPVEVTDAWRTEARLLLDKDGVDLQEALAVLDWTQRDHFWHKNINSMPTFRAQYGQLELKSRDSRGGAPVAATGTTHQSPTPLPPRAGGYNNAKNFGKKRS